jgi:F0F1-type ATP synthase assembly protein I
MTPQTINPDRVLRFAIGCVVVSIVSAVAFTLARHTGSVRGPAGGVGIMASLIGSGVAVWFALRARDRRLAATAVFSVLPLSFWSWVIYEIVHD